MISFRVVPQDTEDLVLECVWCGQIIRFPESMSAECVSREQFHADAIALAVSQHPDCGGDSA